ncbi:carboxy-terminal processing protease CtpB precursor [Oxobacter pfennigii]|uniref:Carboxy-terminal processing protease CtpB n=1 Tax=Oxobacter pfennigii TaxID=36849 RepID=A0A0P8W5Z9_9CLOT|nr:S41 family peptidase [Oxobacter pfennigii]KPU43413.1 carboxy-terminal processing protease CtpB precursor [Oxobacter pfennigii]
MITKRKAILWVVAAVLVTNISTFMLSNFISVGLGNKYIVTEKENELIKKFNKLFVVKDIIEKQYVDPIDESKLIEGAVAGMVQGVNDPYTEYMTPEEYSASTEAMEGEYAGVGLIVTLIDDKVTVVSPIEDTPGYKAGMKSGDVIIGVNDTPTTGKKLNDVVSMMKGKAGTEVKLTVIKNGESSPVEVKIVRENIVLNPVKSEMMGDNIGYIRISTFNQENVADSFNQALQSLKIKKMKGLVLDLRDNGGGLLSECKKVADMLLGEGTIVYTIDNQNRKEVLTSDPNKVDVPIVVLVNGGTASASEIVSGAIKDTKSGTLVGTKTFGKGLVQTIIPLTWDKSAVKVTIARYYTPSGISIQGKGIEPDVVVELPEELQRKSELTRQEDVQLIKALEIVEEQTK